MTPATHSGSSSSSARGSSQSDSSPAGEITARDGLGAAPAGGVFSGRGLGAGRLSPLVIDAAPTAEAKFVDAGEAAAGPCESPCLSPVVLGRLRSIQLMLASAIADQTVELSNTAAGH
jgi:hypothetical protein